MAKPVTTPRPRKAPQPAAPAALSARDGLPRWMFVLSEYRGYIAPVAFVLMTAVLLVPLPPVVMDALICLNISLALVVLLTTIYMREPLDFSVFPSLLLATTLFRLVLNVASTRLILTADASTPEEAATVAGHVIMAFGEFVAGDNMFVGVVIFLILVVVQFLVITKGATRISEVAARFTLDAMPGKQMAIDADLNAGIIDESEARRRREKISQEADFYGAMDGASKFVRGDAIAGLLITIINVVGGFVVGVGMKGWEAGQTAKVFTKLSIGDGLSSQIPAFVISIASALIVTRSGAKQQLGDQFADQVVSQPRGLAIVAVFMTVLVFTPLPTIPLLTIAVVLGGIAFYLWKAEKKAVTAQAEEPGAASAAPQAPAIDNLLKVDTLELEVGYGLVQLVEKSQGGDLLDRISAIRRQLAVELGLVMPPVRIRDNMQIAGSEYRIKIRGNAVAAGAVRPGKLLAMDAGLATGPIEGEKTKEPAFGLDAWWIDGAMRPRAELLNYTVVEPTSVLGTHLTEVVKTHAEELLTRDELGNLIEQLRQRAPKLVEDTVPAVLKPAELQRVLQNLLRERVPIRDLETILEAIAEWGPKTKDLEVLTEYARNALRRTISHQFSMQQGPGARKIICVTLDPSLEDVISAYIDRGPAGTTLTMPSRVASAIARHVGEALQGVTRRGGLPVVIASPPVRAVVRQIVDPIAPGVAVLGYNEVVQGIDVESVALVMPPTEVMQHARVAGAGIAHTAA
ncbi:MAG TPA: flagellar biosynthesis protein FlhA [Phycisphaerales bacterium]|nr:flagellar biosynthesis protein FlhA [Phycisphaerales bacterium]